MLKRIKYIKKENEYDDVYTFFFEKNNIEYKAGQYAKILAIGEERETRVLSFSSYPSETELKFTMHTDTDSPFKNKLLSLTEGEQIFLYNIEGKLKFPMEDEKDYVFLSGGVGIAPYRSIIKEHSIDNLDKNLNVTIAQVQQEKHLFKNELHSLVSRYIDIHPDNFDDDILNLINENKNSIFYVCGSKRFIDGVGKLFNHVNFPKSRIQLEKFKEKSAEGNCYTCTCGLREVCNC